MEQQMPQVPRLGQFYSAAALSSLHLRSESLVCLVSRYCIGERYAAMPGKQHPLRLSLFAVALRI